MRALRPRALIAVVAGGWGLIALAVWRGPSGQPVLAPLFDGIERLYARLGPQGYHLYGLGLIPVVLLAMFATFAIPAAAALVAVARMLAQARLRATGVDRIATLRAAAERRPRALAAALVAPGALAAWLPFALAPVTWKTPVEVLAYALPALLAVGVSSLFMRGLFNLLVAPLAHPAAADQEGSADGYTFAAVAVTRETRAAVGALGALSLGVAALLVALPPTAFETSSLQVGVGAYIAMAAAAAYAFRRASRIALGLDGVLITGSSRRRFFAYRELDAVTASTSGDVELRRAGRVVLRLQLHGEDAGRRAAIVSRIDAGIARAGAPGAAHRFAEAATASHLALAARGEVDYRQAGATREELWEVLEAPAARADARTRAAAALAPGSDGTDRKRLRVAAEHCAEPTTRAELMRIVEAEAEAAAVEASAAARVIGARAVRPVGAHPMHPPTAHAYPHDLAVRTEARWTSLPPGPALPPTALLEQILSTAFQASLLRDEERPVTFRLLLADPDALPASGGPPDGLLRLAFDRPRRFAVDELRRLSPAAKYHRALIGLGISADGRIEIWGIAQSGPRWLQPTQGGRAADAPLPDLLVVRVTGPGRIFVARGSTTVTGLQGGRLTDEAMDVLSSRWLPARFAPIRAELADLHDEAARAASPARAVDPDVIHVIGQQMVKRIVANIRSTHHGGMILFLPPDCAEAMAQGRHLHVKYACRDEEPRRRYRTLMLAVMRVLAEATALVPSGEAVGWSAYRGWESRELAALDEAILEMAQLVAALAGVDGAVVLTKRFEVLGFGGEITGDLPEVTTVQRALDLEATLREPEVVDAMGTRHRSAYRLCARFPEALAIVISQDGGVRFVGWHGGAVTYWDHTSLGSEEA